MQKSENWIHKIGKKYGSLEAYLRCQNDGGAEPILFGYAPFHYLLKRKLLINGDIIRTNLEGGIMDGHYVVNNEGNLEGIEAAGGLYSGDPGIHCPKRILSLKKADNGWTLSFLTVIRICRGI